MALFKLRKKVDEPVAPSSPAESIDAMRRRARHRLVGAAVLVLAGVIGFPLLFDTQPRPVSVDIPIEIPDRNKVKPLPPLPAAPQAAGKVTAAPEPASAPIAAATPTAAPAQARPETVITEQAEPAPARAAKPEPAAPKLAKAEPPQQKAAPRSDEADKARALLEGKTIDSAPAGGRYVVQVGAFAEKDKAHQAQQKLQRAGLKNYTQVADTGDGKRIRVRAGPFASRAEADKAAEKIKGLDLPVRILAL